MTRRTVGALCAVALVGAAWPRGAAGAPAAGGKAAVSLAQATATPRLATVKPLHFDRDGMQDGRLEALEIRLEQVEARLAKTEQQLAQARAQLAQTAPALVMLKVAYDKHTHLHEEPYLGGVWPVSTFKAHMNDGNLLVHVIDNTKIPSSMPQGTTGGPQN